MNLPLIAAGVLALLASAIHGIVGEVGVLQRVRSEALPVTFAGGPSFSMLMIRASWHFVTATFGLSGLALIYVGWNPAAPVAAGVTVMTGALFAAFAVVALVGPITFGHSRAFLRHPAPIGLTATAVLIWVGASGL